MEVEKVESSVEQMLKSMHCLDQKKQQTAIETYYDAECKLQNPYMILTTRSEITSLFHSLSDQNTELTCEIDSVNYDAVLQVASVKMRQTINPKALGGLLPIKIEQEIKLQLERLDSEEGLLYVTDHHEVHAAQEYISRLPVVGSWYDTSLREVMGKLVLTGSSLITATGILNYVPSYVESAIGAAYGAKDTVVGVTGGALELGQSALSTTKSTALRVAGDVYDYGSYAADVTGVTGLVSSGVSVAESVRSSATDAVHNAQDRGAILVEFAKQTAHVVKLKAAQYVETHNQVKVTCYSCTCVPGLRCYSPSCPRNKEEGGFAISDVVGCVYKDFTTSRKEG